MNFERNFKNIYERRFLQYYNTYSKTTDLETYDENRFEEEVVKKMFFIVRYEEVLNKRGQLHIAYDFRGKEIELIFFYSKRGDTRRWNKGFALKYLKYALELGANSMRRFKVEHPQLVIKTEYNCPIKLLYYYYKFMDNLSNFNSYDNQYTLIGNLYHAIERIEGLKNIDNEKRLNEFEIDFSRWVKASLDIRNNNKDYKSILDWSNIRRFLMKQEQIFYGIGAMKILKNPQEREHIWSEMIDNMFDCGLWSCVEADKEVIKQHYHKDSDLKWCKKILISR